MATIEEISTKVNNIGGQVGDIIHEIDEFIENNPDIEDTHKIFDHKMKMNYAIGHFP